MDYLTVTSKVGLAVSDTAGNYHINNPCLRTPNQRQANVSDYPIIKGKLSSTVILCLLFNIQNRACAQEILLMGNSWGSCCGELIFVNI